MMTSSAQTEAPPTEIVLIIVYGVNLRLEGVVESETIEDVKLDAMRLFGISEAEKDHFVLRAVVDGHEQQLDEAKTVGVYHLHDEQKVTLAAGTPFGVA